MGKMRRKIKQNRNAIWPKLMLLSAALIWGSSFFVLKNTLDDLDACFVMAVRFLVGTPIIALLFRKRWKYMTKKTAAAGVGIGFCQFLAYYVQTIGLEGTTPGKNAFLTASYCVFVPFIMWAFTHKRPKKWHLFAALLCITGIALISLPGGKPAISTGDLLSLASGLCFGLHMVLIACFAQEFDTYMLLVAQFATAAICLTAASLLRGETWKLISGKPLASVLYLTIFCTIITICFQFFGQERVEAGPASILLSLESVFGLIFSMLFYGERPTPRALFGFAIVFAAVILSQIEPKRREQEKPAERTEKALTASVKEG